MEAEFGLYFSSESIAGNGRLLIAPTLSFSRPFSHRIDLLFDAWATSLHRPGAHRASLVLAPGFAYWSTPSTRLRSRVRLGFDQYGSWRNSSFVLGADMLLERFVALPGQPAGGKSGTAYLIPSLRLEAGSRHPLERTRRQQTTAVEAGLGYDTPVPFPSSRDGQWRGKIAGGAGLAREHGEGWRPRLRASAALRLVAPRSGNLVFKYEAAAVADFKGNWRVSVGLARGF